ncbi:GDSL-type esterase/lipase family protein [Alkalihalobacillus deserti]|uniref:GDSL-type esterase/lipase family protein n=1 Tax=Alkalihalobacillus deserti TaxID=2879466 RepID=UPI001D13D748|nr:GDSL-type esterase/lipase family protein [Alkalihalobacillus deserti]
MKTVIRSLTLLLVLTLLFSTNALAKNENAKLSLVALGDSIPYGYNLGHNNNASTSKYAYPYLIGNDADMRVRNLAVPGWQTGHMLNALQTDQKYRQAISQADYITLTIGNNDLLLALNTAWELSGKDLQSLPDHLNAQIATAGVKLATNLPAIISEIRSLTEAPIIFYNVYNPFQISNPLYPVADNVLPGINYQLNALVAGPFQPYQDIVIADAYSAFGIKQAEFVIAGDIHPTKAGQEKLAEIGLSELMQFTN